MKKVITDCGSDMVKRGRSNGQFECNSILFASGDPGVLVYHKMKLSLVQLRPDSLI